MGNSYYKRFLALFTVYCLLFTATASLAAEWEEIERRGNLILGVKDNLRPLGFRGSEGNLEGFEIDIARQLAKELLGDEEAVRFEPVSNLERLPVVYNDEVDITIARVSVTEARSRLVDFSPYYYLDATGFVTSDASMQGLEDLATKKIAVLSESSTIAIVRYELPTAELVGVNSYQEALDLLEAGGADAFAADLSILTGWVQEYPNYRTLPIRLSSVALAVVMPRGLQYVGLRQRVNDAIARWRRSGWLEERATYWGLP